MKIKTILFLLLVALPALLLQAEPNATWEKLNELKPGKKIAIHLKSGGEINGKFKSVEEGQLLITRKNEEIRFKKENIKFVIADKAFSGKRTLIGAAIGFGIGSAYGAYLSNMIGEGYGTAGDRMGMSVGFGALGATAGMLISQIGSRSEEPVLYSAPAMHISVPIP